jgi:ABC-type uncharacterized transport system auxiliary subunit
MAGDEPRGSDDVGRREETMKGASGEKGRNEEARKRGGTATSAGSRFYWGGEIIALVKLVLPVILCTTLLMGCLPRAKPPYAVQSYILEYSLPPLDWPRLNDALRVGRFSVDQSYNTPSMLYKSELYKIKAYNYSRWRDNPGAMMTDCILRDFRGSNLFRAVFLYREQAGTRFTVAGAVEQFLQVRTSEGWRVILSVQATLLDGESARSDKNVVFQKRYRSARAIDQASPEAFASAMSQAMSEVSSEILKDVYQSMKLLTGRPQSG